jgi:hypothetical protein
MTSFTNLLYNELFFYNLFSEYYSYALASDPNLQNEEQELSYKIVAQQDKITKLQNNKIRSQKAISMSIRMLKEIQNTFPFHIGFMMYAEDIYYLAQEINKTLTPIYTLYDLFRNVQIK